MKLILVSNQRSKNETTEAPDTNQDHSLADLHCNNDSTISIHTGILAQDDPHGPDFDDEDRGDAHSMDSVDLSSENGSHISSASKEEDYESNICSETRLDDVHNLLNFESNMGQSWMETAKDRVNPGTIIFPGEGNINPVPYQSFEARHKQAEDRKMILLERRRDLGEYHADTLAAMEDLAWTHHELGEYMAARDLRVMVVEKQQSILGENDPDMLRTVGNLASTYSQLGQFKQSERLEV
ncbi:hypothetical protein B0H19DRAFT_1277103 [Mycena capillaripes]|nr:hypothetical protein B0H19DRAFT_1277103 [Mycena capillaripes]